MFIADRLQCGLMTWSKALGRKRGENTGRSGKLLIEELYDLYCLAEYCLGIKEVVMGRTCGTRELRET